MAQWLACWAHNSKVGGSKPLSANFASPLLVLAADENDDHGRTRTYNLRFRRPTPYPLGHAADILFLWATSRDSLETQLYGPRVKKPMAGIEPTTSRLLSGCSTAKLHWLRHVNISPLWKLIVGDFLIHSTCKTLLPGGIEPPTSRV